MKKFGNILSVLDCIALFGIFLKLSQILDIMQHPLGTLS
jgi:hypothetical protein